MIDWFDIFMKVITCAALFFAGYNIGYSRGFDTCKKAVHSAFEELGQTMILQDKFRKAKEKGCSKE